MAQKKKRWGIYLVLGMVFFSGFMVYRMISSETNNAVVNLVLKKQSKTYVYSHMGEAVVQNSLKKEESPGTFPFIQVFEEDGKLFIAPNKLKEIASLLCGNYEIHNHSEESIDGYVTSSGSACFETSFKNQNTEKIGEQIRVNTVQLLNQQTGKTFDVKWHTNMWTFKSVASKNCYLKSFMIKTSVQPSEFVISSKDFIMADLEDVTDFYGSQVILTLNEEDQLLYIEYK
ncbi:hypothetical protein [Flagellimonas onchidii]|uniref:hypothetical protein n=1 Tax=Flagellimonas onchidii TaxID=2562684 RepID=UPI0010A6A91C|nr:hypothetical protein [Allomuricauda onchidii]